MTGSATPADKAEQLKEVASEATDSRPARVLARGGLIASGAMHILIGVIAIGVVNGLHQRADQSGALDAIADVPGGTIVLWIAAIALLGLAIWQWTGPMAPRPEGVVPNRWRDRAKSLAYAVVGFVAAIFASGGQTDSAEQTRTVSALLINLPGGLFIVAAAGIGVTIVGVLNIVRGVTRRFTEDITPPDGAAGAAVITLGVAGFTCKGLALTLIGALFVGGAFLHDASWTSGLDGAIRFLTTLPTGIWPLGVIAVGLIAHGIYLFLRARYMRR